MVQTCIVKHLGCTHTDTGTSVGIHVQVIYEFACIAMAAVTLIRVL